MKARHMRKGEARATLEALGRMSGRDTAHITDDMEGGYKPARQVREIQPEENDQQALVQECRALGYPFDRVLAVSNEAVFRFVGKGLAKEQVATRWQWQLKMGARKDALDLMWPVARCGYHGLVIEMKRRELTSNGKVVQRPGVVRPGQQQEIDQLLKDGYFAAVAYGDGDAWRILNRYFRGERR